MGWDKQGLYGTLVAIQVSNLSTRRRSEDTAHTGDLKHRTINTRDKAVECCTEECVRLVLLSII